MSIMKPKVPKGPGVHTVFQRHQHHNQQVAQAVRPPLPRDGFQDGRPTFASGELPKGGYQSTWAFGWDGQTKKSPTGKAGVKVY